MNEMAHRSHARKTDCDIALWGSSGDPLGILGGSGSVWRDPGPYAHDFAWEGCQIFGGSSETTYPLYNIRKPPSPYSCPGRRHTVITLCFRHVRCCSRILPWVVVWRLDMGPGVWFCCNIDFVIWLQNFVRAQYPGTWLDDDLNYDKRSGSYLGASAAPLAWCQ